MHLLNVFVRGCEGRGRVKTFRGGKTGRRQPLGSSAKDKFTRVPDQEGGQLKSCGWRGG